MSDQGAEFGFLSGVQRAKEEAKALSSLKNELMNLREIVDGPITTKEAFSAFLKKGINTQEFPRESGLGKFLRTFRYYPEIYQTAKDVGVPMDYFFALKMIEGEGDPTNINTSDGGAGISQIQPDTFKWFARTHLNKKYKVFSDNAKYKAYDYDLLMKKYKNRVKVNGIIAKKLLQIKSANKADLDALMKLDDRFNPQIALEFSAKYLLFCKKQVKVDKLTDKSRNQYKNDTRFDFERLLAFNGYNKGPARYSVDFTGNHITNLKTRINQYKTYSQKLETYLKQGITGKQILKQFLLGKTVEQKTKEGDIVGLEYKNISKDGKYKVYKFTVGKVNNLSQLFWKFKTKKVIVTDKAGKSIHPISLHWKVGNVFYIKEPIT